VNVADVNVGASMPELDIAITTATVVGGAMATRDFTPFHHDKAAAAKLGLPDVCLNILTTNGFVCRYVAEWAGPDAMITNVRNKLGGPCFPGDTLQMRGTVAAVEGSVAHLEVVGSTARGKHVSSTVTVDLEPASSRSA
jgi:acyl dehydratase